LDGLGLGADVSGEPEMTAGDALQMLMALFLAGICMGLIGASIT